MKPGGHCSFLVGYRDRIMKGEKSTKSFYLIWCNDLGPFFSPCDGYIEKDLTFCLGSDLNCSLEDKGEFFSIVSAAVIFMGDSDINLLH